VGSFCWSFRCKKDGGRGTFKARAPHNVLVYNQFVGFVAVRSRIFHFVDINLTSKTFEASRMMAKPNGKTMLKFVIKTAAINGETAPGPSLERK